jgi:hypothetical protein
MLQAQQTEKGKSTGNGIHSAVRDISQREEGSKTLRPKN